MNLNIPIATGMFALSVGAMVLFFVVWCLTGLVALVVFRRSGCGRYHDAYERERNVRGLTLLKNWLTPAQLQSYEKFGYFDITGSDSGTIYRIHHGQQANVEQLDHVGQPVCAWCFVPVGDLVAGDVMLAQKIALESDERAAMSVAVKYATLRIRRGGHALNLDCSHLDFKIRPILNLKSSLLWAMLNDAFATGTHKSLLKQPHSSKSATARRARRYRLSDTPGKAT